MEKTSPTNDRQFARAGALAIYGPDRPIRVRHIELDLRPDLDAKRIDASATLTVEAIEDGVSEIVLDAVDLEILGVETGGEPLGFVSRTR